MKESDYVKQLRRLIIQIKTIGPLESKSEDLLNEAAQWECPYKAERKLLNDLIVKAREYLRLKRIMYFQSFSNDVFEKYLSYSKWLNSLCMLLETFEVPLSKISLSNLSLKE